MLGKKSWNSENKNKCSCTYLPVYVLLYYIAEQREAGGKT